MPNDDSRYSGRGWSTDREDVARLYSILERIAASASVEDDADHATLLRALDEAAGLSVRALREADTAFGHKPR